MTNKNYTLVVFKDLKKAKKYRSEWSKKYGFTPSMLENEDTKEYIFVKPKGLKRVRKG